MQRAGLCAVKGRTAMHALQPDEECPGLYMPGYFFPAGFHSGRRPRRPEALQHQLATEARAVIALFSLFHRGIRQERKAFLRHPSQKSCRPALAYGLSSERNFRESRKTITLRGGRVMVSSVCGLRPLREDLS